MKAVLARLIALICAVVCAAAGSVPLQIYARSAANEWRVYDAHGGLIERQLDTNGDGRPDVAEYYRDGALLRRDSDRDFNGVTDLVEDFDATTKQRVRSIVDEDYDGTADVLVLFRNGKAVVSERAPSSSATPDGRVRRGDPRPSSRSGIHSRGTRRSTRRWCRTSATRGSARPRPAA